MLSYPYGRISRDSSSKMDGCLHSADVVCLPEISWIRADRQESSSLTLRVEKKNAIQAQGMVPAANGFELWPSTEINVECATGCTALHGLRNRLAAQLHSCTAGLLHSSGHSNPRTTAGYTASCTTGVGFREIFLSATQRALRDNSKM